MLYTKRELKVSPKTIDHFCQIFCISEDLSPMTILPLVRQHEFNGSMII